MSVESISGAEIGGDSIDGSYGIVIVETGIMYH